MPMEHILSRGQFLEPKLPQQEFWTLKRQTNKAAKPLTIAQEANPHGVLSEYSPLATGVPGARTTCPLASALVTLVYGRSTPSPLDADPLSITVMMDPSHLKSLIRPLRRSLTSRFRLISAVGSSITPTEPRLRLPFAPGV